MIEKERSTVTTFVAAVARSFFTSFSCAFSTFLLFVEKGLDHCHTHIGVKAAFRSFDTKGVRIETLLLDAGANLFCPEKCVEYSF